MADIYEEYESCNKLLIKEYKILKKLNPKSYLLTLLKNDDEGFEVTEEFLKRYKYGNSGENNVIIKELDAFRKYYSELNREVTQKLIEKIAKEKKRFNEELEDILTKEGLIGAVRTHITHNEVPLIN
jgi:hypothetical protein